MNERPRENFQTYSNNFGGRWEESANSNTRFINSSSKFSSSERRIKNGWNQGMQFVPSEELTTSVKSPKNGIKRCSGPTNTDPRFKRIIPIKSDPGIESEGKSGKTLSQKLSTMMEESETGSKAKSFIEVIDKDKRPEEEEEELKIEDTEKVTDKNENSEIPCDSVYFTGTDMTDMNSSHDHLKEVDKLKLNLNLDLPKRSLSESTLQTKNTSPRSDVDSDEIVPTPKLPSVNQKWSRCPVLRPGKRRSLCTVVGQVPVSRSVMCETSQRRRISRGVDKQSSLIGTIMETPDKEKRTNLVIQVKREVFGRVYDFDECCNTLVTNEKDYKYPSKRNVTSATQGRQACRGGGDLIPERDLSANRPARRPNRFKSRGTQKTDAEGEMSLAGKIFPSARAVYIFVVLSGILYWFLLSEINPSEIFFLKPKSQPWYERLLY